MASPLRTTGADFRSARVKLELLEDGLELVPAVPLLVVTLELWLLDRLVLGVLWG